MNRPIVRNRADRDRRDGIRDVDRWINRTRYGRDQWDNNDWNRQWDGRAGWDRYWTRRYVHRGYQNFYSGNWYGNWPNRWSQWDRPVTYGLMGWGFNSLGFRGGYYQYSNPYYISDSFAPAVDYYSTPIIVDTYDPSDYEADQEPGLAEFDRARQEFKAGAYQTALEWTEQALMERSQDPVIHEFRALCLFAVGEYRKTAVVLNSLLATSPGWNWRTMANLYPSTRDYEVQLRALERFRNEHPNDASSRFVLAYHYLVTGSTEAAQSQLERVVKLEPNDQVAARLLRGLTGETANAPPQPPPVALQPVAPMPDLEADLAGNWKATREDGSTFQLDISEDGTFRWIVTDKSQREETIEGDMTVADDVLVLQGTGGGTMVGRVLAQDADRFTFTLIGGPEDDHGLLFVRQQG